MAIAINVNGTTRTIDVDADTPLLWALRDVLGISGTKFGCGVALCGACTVHVDGVPVRSCVTPVSSVGEKAVTTIEAVGEAQIGKALQQAWLELTSQGKTFSSQSCPRTSTGSPSQRFRPRLAWP